MNENEELKNEDSVQVLNQQDALAVPAPSGNAEVYTDDYMPEVLKLGIDEVRADLAGEGAIKEPVIVEKLSQRLAGKLRAIHREISMSRTTLLQEVREQMGPTLSRFLTMDDLKIALESGQVVLRQISLDNKFNDLSHKCVRLVVYDHQKSPAAEYSFLLYEAGTEILVMMVEEGQQELFQRSKE